MYAQSGVAIADRLVEQHVAERRQPGVLPRYLPLCQSYLLVLATADRWERAVELLWDLVERGDPAPDAACYDAALLACRRSGRWREALQLFNHIKREDVRAQPTDATYMQAIMTMLVVSFFFHWKEGYCAGEERGGGSFVVGVYVGRGMGTGGGGRLACVLGIDTNEGRGGEGRGGQQALHWFQRRRVS